MNKSKSPSVKNFFKSLSNSKLTTGDANSRLPANKIESTGKVVDCCRACKMVHVSDRKRIMCPYCGTFFDPNEEKLVVRPKPRMTQDSASSSNDIRSRRSSLNNNNNSGSNSLNCSDDDDDDYGEDDENRVRKRDKMRHFLRSLVPFRGATKRSESVSNLKASPEPNNANRPPRPPGGADPKLMSSKSVDQDGPVSPFPSLPKLDEPKVEESSLHPFIDVNNKQPEFFADYKRTAPRTQDEFRFVLLLYSCMLSLRNYI
jgi:hypothetical protein